MQLLASKAFTSVMAVPFFNKGLKSGLKSLYQRIDFLNYVFMKCNRDLSKRFKKQKKKKKQAMFDQEILQ